MFISGWPIHTSKYGSHLAHDNGVLLKIEAGRKIYSHDCLQKLTATEYDRALIILIDEFSQQQPPPGSTAEWTAAAEAGLGKKQISCSYDGSVDELHQELVLHFSPCVNKSST